MKFSLNRVVIIPSLVLPPILLFCSVWGACVLLRVYVSGRFEHLPAEAKQLGIVMFAASMLNSALSMLSLYLSFWKRAFRPSFIIISLIMLVFSLAQLYFDLCPWPAIK